MDADHGTPPLPSLNGPVAQSVAAPAKRDQGHRGDRRLEAQRRHLQVIELASLGLTTKQIASTLGVSASVVHWHRNREKAIQARRLDIVAGISGEEY